MLESQSPGALHLHRAGTPLGTWPGERHPGWGCCLCQAGSWMGPGSPTQACLQRHVLMEASVPPQVHFSLFPCAKLSNPSRAGRSRTLKQAGELLEAQKEAQSPSGGSGRSSLETSGRISGSRLLLKLSSIRALLFVLFCFFRHCGLLGLH